MEKEKNISNFLKNLDSYSSIIKNICKDLIEEKYTIFLANHIDNIFIFYKIDKNNLFITFLQGTPSFILNKESFKIKNYFFDIRNLNVSSSNKDYFLTVKNEKNEEEIRCYTTYGYENEDPNYKMKKENFFKNIYFLNKEINKKQQQYKKVSL